MHGEAEGDVVVQMRRLPSRPTVLDVIAIDDGCVVFGDGEVGIVDGGAIPWDFIDDDRRTVMGSQLLGAVKSWNDGPIECLIVDVMPNVAEVEETLRRIAPRNDVHAHILAEMAMMLHQAEHAVVAPKRTVWRLPGESLSRDARMALETRIRKAQDRARHWAMTISAAAQTNAYPMRAEDIAQLLYLIADPYRRLWAPIPQLLERVRPVVDAPSVRLVSPSQEREYGAR